jgi:hypothetical protein
MSRLIREMKLQEQISRIKSMMKIVTEDVPTNVRRRLSTVNKLLDSVLIMSNPCDFVDVNHFKEQILTDIDTLLLTIDVLGMANDEIVDFVRDYLNDDIERFYIDSKI